jgi:DNA (cytosine-5)-methyltransferase 1
MNKTELKVGALFAGVGGIELGFMQAGFTPLLANEIDKNAGITYMKNFKHDLIIKDIHELAANEFPKINVLTGGFPCQAFSVAGYRKGFKDPRGNVFWEIVRILEKKKPEVIFLENVKNLTTHDGGRTFKIVLEALTDLGYHIKYKIMNAYEYSSIPQNRERIYIVGFRTKKYYNNFEFPEKNNLKLDLSKYIDFENKIEDNFYYNDKYMSKKLIKEITNRNTVYQWRRQYVRENKSGLCPTLTANMGTGGHNVPLVLTKYGIRKLTPKECFNLMGFPKSFKLPSNVSNGNLYKQAGNAVVVPVIKRIAVNIRKAMEA